MLAVLLIAVIVTAVAMTAGGEGNTRVPGGPIRVPPPNVYYLPYEEGDVFTDGFMTVELRNGARGTLRSVELIGGEGLELLGVKVAGKDRKYNSIQVTEGYPPNRRAFGALRDATGAEIPAGRLGLELLVGLKVATDEYTVRDGLRVHYPVNGTDYVADFPASIAICPPVQLTVDECREEFEAEADW